MKKSNLLITSVAIGVLFIFAISQAQDFKLSDEHRTAMKKLEFLVGNWEGEAWSTMPNQPKETIIQTEVVRWGLDESILIIEGIGKQLDPATQKEKVVHDALGILSYDPQKNQYRLNSYVADGRSTMAEAQLNSDGDFIWAMDPGNGFKIRYTITLNDAGQWIEKGEWSRDGENWSQFFGMTLDRVK